MEDLPKFSRQAFAKRSKKLRFPKIVDKVTTSSEILPKRLKILVLYKLILCIHFSPYKEPVTSVKYNSPYFYRY